VQRLQLSSRAVKSFNRASSTYAPLPAKSRSVLEVVRALRELPRSFLLLGTDFLKISDPILSRPRFATRSGSI